MKRRAAAAVLLLALSCAPREERLAASVTDAAAILDRVAATYAALPEYHDHGRVVTSNNVVRRLFDLVVRGAAHDTFSTSFRRGAPVSFTYTVSRGTTRRASGDTSALAGVTSLASVFVPRLLAGDTRYLRLNGPRLEPSTRIHDRPCDVVSGRRDATVFELAVDQQTSLVQRVRLVLPDSDTTIDYWPAK